LKHQQQGSPSDDGGVVFLTQNENGMTLLHAAAANGAHEQVLMALMDNTWFRAGLANKAGRLPLQYVGACISGKIPPGLCAQRLIV
jgi:hypothetical protein